MSGISFFTTSYNRIYLFISNIVCPQVLNPVYDYIYLSLGIEEQIVSPRKAVVHVSNYLHILFYLFRDFRDAAYFSIFNFIIMNYSFLSTLSNSLINRYHLLIVNLLDIPVIFTHLSVTFLTKLATNNKHKLLAPLIEIKI